MVGADEVLASNIKGFVGHAFGAQMELDGTKLALAVTVACVTVARESHGHGSLTGERNESESVGDELVIENRGVNLDFDKVNGNGGNFGDHDTAESVGHAGIGLTELELGVVVLDFPDLDFWETLVGYSFHCCSSSSSSTSLFVSDRCFGQGKWKHRIWREGNQMVRKGPSRVDDFQLFLFFFFKSIFQNRKY